VLIFAHEDPDSETLDELQSRGVEVICQQSSVQDFSNVLEELAKRSIQSVLVEGGPLLAGLMLEAGAVDKVTFFVAPMIIGSQDAPSAIGGSGAEKINEAPQLDGVDVVLHGRDVEISGYPRKIKD
jgi:diaminohydroxyphosphoribosylaminopyrimidine deaminase/5-amino-6-(5-phosphoribosylamino)uracil reductase